MTVYRPKSKAEIYRNMSAIRSRENATEVQLRQQLHSKGLRFRKYRKDLPGNPDIVFVRQRVAVFVDGDFWHGRVLVEKGFTALKSTLRTSTRGYWLEKLTRNVQRDRQATAALEERGWLVLRMWESDVKRDIRAAAAKIAAALARR